jgi:hypothetical protein
MVYLLNSRQFVDAKYGRGNNYCRLNVRPVAPPFYLAGRHRSVAAAWPATTATETGACGQIWRAGLGEAAREILSDRARARKAAAAAKAGEFFHLIKKKSLLD